MMIDQQATAAVLKDFRLAHGYTIAQLADKLNVVCNTPYHWEWGDRLPNIETLFDLAELYGVAIEELVIPEKGQRNE